ncbi:MAG TPA: AsmA family protein [Candidatus Barnesiella excrementigallinarum]|nr:AsmA family protein [Candidatus Barnesiella excrementigallinarum]
MNKGLKTGLKVIGITVAAILVLMLLLPFVFKDKVMTIVKNEANEMLNARLDFESLDISLFTHFPSASIELNGLTLSGIGDFENDTLVSAKSIDVAVNVMSLFGDEGFDVNYIVLDKPSVKAVKLADGRVNWDIMKPDTVADEAAAEEESDSSFRLKLKNFKITDATIVYMDDSTRMQFYTDKLNLKLSGDMSADVTDIDSKFSCENIYFSMDGVSYLKKAEVGAKLTVSADLKNNKFTLKENSLRLNAIVLNLDGWVSLLDNGAMDMDLKLNTPEINFKEILSLIPAIYQNNFDRLRTTGNMSLTAFAKGRMEGDTFPQFGLTLGVTDATFNYEGMPASVDGIRIAAAVSNPGGDLDKTVVDVSEFRLSMAGNPFKATLYASTPMSDLNFKATVDGTIHLGKVKDIYPLGDSISLSGIVTADLRLAGRMSDIEKENYEKIEGAGTFAISDMDLVMKGLPAVAVKQAKASISAKSMSLSQLDVKVGRSDIQAQGSLSNYLAYVMKDETLKGTLAVSSSMLDLNELMGESSSEEEAEADTTALSVIEVPKNLDLTLNADFKKILFQKMELDNVKGKLIVANGAVRMAPLSLNAFGGSMVANGLYSTAESVTRPKVNFDVDIQKASFEKTFDQLDMVQQIVPIFQKTGGNYSVKFDLQSTLDSQMSPDLNLLTARGVIQSNDIQLQNVEVFNQLATLLKNDKLKDIEAKDLKISFEIEDGKVRTSPFDIKMGNVTMNLSGTTGLDQTIDYAAKINIPGAGALSNVSATIGGTFTKPSIKLNTEEVVKDVVTSVVAEKVFGVDAEDVEAQKAAIRKQAEEAGNKLIATAQSESDKLVAKASNPLAKIAAQAAGKKLVEEAEKQAQKLKEEAEKLIEKQYGAR